MRLVPLGAARGRRAGLATSVLVLAVAAAPLVLAQSSKGGSVTGQPEPDSKVVFRQATAAAGKLPALLAAEEQDLIAKEELATDPAGSLQCYQTLYERVHQWPTQRDTAVEKVQAGLRFEIEAHAIQAFARGGKMQQAIAWLQQYQPGQDDQPPAEWVCSMVIEAALLKKKPKDALAVMRDCLAAGDGYPFVAAATVVGASVELGQLQRMAIAREGVHAAASAAPNVENAAKFLIQVHDQMPAMDGEVEDADLGLLADARADREAHPGHSAGDERGSALLLGLLAGIDPTRAQEQRAEYPADAATKVGGETTVLMSQDGKALGFAPAAPVANRLVGLAGEDPDGAIADANQISDAATRFGALASLADALATSKPQKAGLAADAAYALLTQAMSNEATAGTAMLARAYSQLGNAARATEVGTQALDAASKHDEDAEGQLDLSEPEGVARAAKGIAWSAPVLTNVYGIIAGFLPALALKDLTDCDCAVARPLILAKIAAALAHAKGARSLR